MKAKGLTGFQLKIIGLVLMLFDHIYYFFDFLNIPIVLTWLGRIAAPIFMFTTVEGYYHTRSRKRYMLRLYIGFLLMNIGNTLMTRFLPRPDNMILMNNIFSTLFLVTVFLYLLEFIEKAMEGKNTLKVILGGLLFVFFLTIDKIPLLNPIALTKLSNIIPMISITEGGPFFVLVGIAMYMFRADRKKQLLVYSLFIIPFLFIGDTSLKGLFFENYQWMMIFVVPLLYLYNGKRGRGMKYLFYIFYPAHIYILYIFSISILLK